MTFPAEQDHFWIAFSGEVEYSNQSFLPPPF